MRAVDDENYAFGAQATRTWAVITCRHEVDGPVGLAVVGVPFRFGFHPIEVAGPAGFDAAQLRLDIDPDRR